MKHISMRLLENNKWQSGVIPAWSWFSWRSPITFLGGSEKSGIKNKLSWTQIKYYIYLKKNPLDKQSKISKQYPKNRQLGKKTIHWAMQLGKKKKKSKTRNQNSINDSEDYSQGCK